LRALDINNEINQNKKKRAYLRKVLERHLVESRVFQTITIRYFEAKIKCTCPSQYEGAERLEVAYKETDICRMDCTCNGKACRLIWQ